MRNCRKLEVFLSRGKFEETLTTFSSKMQKHVNSCSTCHQFLQDMVDSEAMLHTIPHTRLSSHVKARIRQNVAKTLSACRPSPFRKIAFTSGLLAAAALFLVILFPSSYRQDTHPETSVVRHIDEDMVFDMLEYVEFSLYQYDDTDIEDAVAMNLNDPLFSAAVDTLLETSFSYFDDEYLSMLSDFDEQDWAMLRRYLI